MNNFAKAFARMIKTMVLLSLLIGCQKLPEKQGSDGESKKQAAISFAGQLNGELSDVMWFAVKSNYSGMYTPNFDDLQIVAMKESGESITLMELRTDHATDVMLSFAFNHLFFAYEEDDCIGYIDLTAGDGNYVFVPLIMAKIHKAVNTSANIPPSDSPSTKRLIVTIKNSIPKIHPNMLNTFPRIALATTIALFFITRILRIIKET